MPSSPVPPDQVTDVDIDMDISWTGGDPDGDSVTYDVYFGTASYPPLEAEDLTVTTYDVGTLDCITTYYWKIVATDSFGAITEGPIWSFTTERLNATPTIPDISGKVNGKAGTPYDYTFISTDEDIEDVWYYIEWGDGSIEEWIGPYASGEEAIVSHTWTVKDTYTIRAKARDAYGLESDWGLLEVSMPILKGMFITTFLECIANWFPLLYRFISQFIL
ncbi:MAG: hypothetical protein KKG04_10250 [Candidatus Thermoplasmatota archaeon]|nr:hypothetical protein [Candidatus Thermoplasmatota archaeon]